MDKKKSLGSSPIGYSSLGSNSFQFIRDLGVSSKTGTAGKKGESENDMDTDTDSRDTDTDSRDTGAEKNSQLSQNGNPYTGRESTQKKKSGKKQSKKKIVSYYLEKELIDRLKTLADDHDAYYSAVVSTAIEYWVEKHGY